MATASAVAGLGGLEGGSHVCWIVDDAPTYLQCASALLDEARSTGEKPVLFGPEGSTPLVELSPLAAQVTDPRVAFLGGGPLDPEAMFRMFRQQTAVAHREGYQRLRVVADMDWLLPMRPSTSDIVAFELMLDRHANELDATVVCAYRSSSFDTQATAGALCVHAIGLGGYEPPQFRLVASSGRWSLDGEVDIAVESSFRDAVTAAFGVAPCTIDVSELRFIDVAGLRSLAAAAGTAGTPVQLVGAQPMLLRSWDLSGFGAIAPMVELLS